MASGGPCLSTVEALGPRLSLGHTAVMRKSEKKSVRSGASPEGDLAPSDTRIQDRKRQFEREVELGLRDARSLVAIPAEMARAAELAFPKDAFGTPEPW